MKYKIPKICCLKLQFFCLNCWNQSQLLQGSVSIWYHVMYWLEMVLLVEEVTCVTSCTSVTHSNIHAGFVIFSFILMVQNYKSNTICTMYNTEPQRMEPSSRTDRHVMDAFKTERTNKRDWVITDFSDNISDTVRLWRLWIQKDDEAGRQPHNCERKLWREQSRDRNVPSWKLKENSY